MATRERPVDRGSRLARRILAELGREVREARTAGGLSQRFLAAASGCSAATVSRIERGLQPEASILELARVLACLGLELSCRAYPVGEPVRDAAHLALLGRFRRLAGDRFAWRSEVPVDIPGDRRAWDGVLAGAGVRIGVEAETRLRDVQAVARRLALKRRDSLVDHVALVLADTRGNRTMVRQLDGLLAADFPLPPQAMLQSLRAGRDPGGSAILLI